MNVRIDAHVSRSLVQRLCDSALQHDLNYFVLSITLPSRTAANQLRQVLHRQCQIEGKIVRSIYQVHGTEPPVQREVEFIDDQCSLNILHTHIHDIKFQAMIQQPPPHHVPEHPQVVMTGSQARERPFLYEQPHRLLQTMTGWCFRNGQCPYLLQLLFDGEGQKFKFSVRVPLATARERSQQSVTFSIVSLLNIASQIFLPELDIRLCFCPTADESASDPAGDSPGKDNQSKKSGARPRKTATCS